MRADQVIATHGNTDFDAFGAMLAARMLYPEAVVAVATRPVARGQRRTATGKAESLLRDGMAGMLTTRRPTRSVR